MKTYKVVPHVANVTDKQGKKDVAASVEDLINEQASAGWDFESIEKFETSVTPSGCLALKQQAETTFIQLIIFSKAV